jgi:proline iminopeptidase
MSESHVVQNGDVALHTIVYPTNIKNAETIILLHGGPGVPEAMIQIAQTLNKKFRVINFEQRGTGSSHNPSRDYSMEGYISDIERIANHFELKQFHLFGHSWGGLYAQIYASEHPERLLSLFLSSPSSGTNSLWTETEAEVLAYNQTNSTSWEFLKMGWYSLLGMMGSDRAYQSLFHLVLTVYHRGHAPDTVIDKTIFEGIIKADPINRTRPRIQEYKSLPEKVENPPFPIFMTYGDADIYGPSREKSIARYPAGKSQIIENCGHIPWIHNPDSFFSILSVFYSL